MQDMGDRVALSGETGVRDPMCRAHDPSGVRDEDGCRLSHCEPL